MRLSDATVAIRPRSTWEAMDLGVLMSQQHRRLLIDQLGHRHPAAVRGADVVAMGLAVAGGIHFLVAETGV